MSSITGAGESGKTTIIKQMKILHIQGFSPEERLEKAQEIRENVFEAIKVCNAIIDVNLDYVFKKNSFRN